MSTSTILFVCTGNTCRSQMAEGIARHWLQQHHCGGWKVLSAGTRASDGCSMTKEAVLALEKKNIDFEGKSTALTKELVEQADVVICMTESHLFEVRSLVARVEHVEVLDPGGPVTDPIGQSQGVYDSTAFQLESLIRTRLENLVQQTTQE